MAARRLDSMAIRSFSFRSMPGLKSWKLLRPRSFAWYMAVSEWRSSSPISLPSRGYRLTPMLTVVTSGRPSTITGAPKRFVDATGGLVDLVRRASRSSARR